MSSSNRYSRSVSKMFILMDFAFTKNKKTFCIDEKIADLEKRFVEAEEVKTEGSKVFVEGKYEDAVKAYEQADEMFGSVFVKTYRSVAH